MDTLFFDVLLNGGVLFLCMTAGFYGFAALLGVKVTMLNMCGIVFGSFARLVCLPVSFRAAGQMPDRYCFSLYLLWCSLCRFGGAFPDYMLPKILVGIGKILPGGVFVDLFACRNERTDFFTIAYLCTYVWSLPLLSCLVAHEEKEGWHRMRIWLKKYTKRFCARNSFCFC